VRTTQVRGISCEGFDASDLADQTRKSNLLLEGRLLEAQGQFDAAAEKFATAAEIEERLTARCRELGLREERWVHAVSAVGCWARAGNFYTALRLGDELLADPDLTERLRRHVQAFQDTIRAKRREWGEKALAAEAEASA
jgi:hypothetical protein